MNTALQYLCRLADQRKAERSSECVPQDKYDDKDTKGLIRCIVDYLTFSGYHPIRIGTYCADLPEVLTVIKSRAVFVEVKKGSNALSDTRKQAILALQKAGALIYVAHDFEGFFAWNERNIQTLSDLPTTTSVRPHPIPWLATPDLPPLTKASRQQP